MEERSFVPSAVGEPRWASHMCDHQGGSKDFKLFEVVAVVTEGAAHTMNLCWNCYNNKASEARRSRGKRCLLEGVGGAEVFLWQGMGSVWCGMSSREQGGSDSQSKKCGPERF